MRPQHPRFRHRAGPWWVARGIHRRIFGALLLAGALGAAATWLGHDRGAWPLVLAAICAWPLAWSVTWRVARPLRELAEAARRLHHGELADPPPTTVNDEVGEVAGALGDMVGRVRKQLRDQRALLAAVSHELRSPLGRARVLVELMRDGAAPADAHDRLQAEIDRMDGLIADLLAGARIDFEAVSPQPLKASELGRRALDLARLDPDLLKTDEDATVRADPTLVARALGLLLDNASRHGGQPQALRVSPGAEAVRFTVEDDGPGFAPGEEELAFQPFWRAPGEHKAQGVGLGLALVRQVAEAHGGSAGAGNRPEGGARVWIELPADQGPG